MSAGHDKSALVGSEGGGFEGKTSTKIEKGEMKKEDRIALRSTF